MKVLYLGGSNSRNSGGVFFVARDLGKVIAKRPDFSVEYLMHGDEYTAADLPTYEGLKMNEYSIKGPSNLAFSFDIADKLKHIQPDIVHVHSLWLYASFVNKNYYKKTNTPYMISPHGMLDIWQLNNSGLKKKIALKLYESEHIRNAHCIHALCKSEYDSIRDVKINNPVAIIPNGVHLPDLTNKKTGTKRLLFLSRIHKKKGIEVLLEGWAKSNYKSNDWKLVIAGETKDQPYFDSLIALTKQLGIENSVEFVGGKFGNEKHEAFLEADAFVLPSYSEGLPMAILEAWAYKLPVLMTRECNLPEGFEAGAALEIRPEATSICTVLDQLFTMPQEAKEEIGIRALELVKSKYTWEQVASSMMDVYKWMKNEGPKPACIH